MNILILTWRDLAHEAAGGAEVYTEQVARQLGPLGHDVTLFAAAVAGRPAEEIVDGYRVVRAGGRFTVYREARRWWQRQGRFEGFDVVIDMINTVPFPAHAWINDVPDGGASRTRPARTSGSTTPRGPPPARAAASSSPAGCAPTATSRPWRSRQSTRDALRRLRHHRRHRRPRGLRAPRRCVDAAAKEERPTIVWCARHGRLQAPDGPASTRPSRCRRASPTCRSG